MVFIRGFVGACAIGDVDMAARKSEIRKLSTFGLEQIRIDYDDGCF